MGRPRIPTEELERRGAFEKNPARGEAREGEPKPEKLIGDPPAHFTEPQKDAWREVVSRCHEGVLSDADSLAVEMAAVLLAQFRAAPDDFAVSKITRLNALLSQFGMTPSDRSRVKVRSAEKKNRFGELRNRARPLYVVPKQD